MLYAYHHLTLESSLLMDYSVDWNSASLCEVANDSNKSIANVKKETEDKMKVASENENMLTVTDNDTSNELSLSDETVKSVEAFNQIITSVSMFKTFHIPYILTDAGKNSPIRDYLVRNIFYSKYFEHTDEVAEEQEKEDKLDPDYLMKLSYKEISFSNDHHSYRPSGTVLLPRHEFITEASVLHGDESLLQKSLVRFRSYGGRIYNIQSPALQDGQSTTVGKTSHVF